PQDAGEAGERSGNRKGDQAEAPDAQAEEGGAGLIVTDRLQRLAERRMHDHPQDYDADGKQCEHIVIVSLNEALERSRATESDEAEQETWSRDPQPIGSPGDPKQLERQAVDHLRQGKRQDAEEDARVADANIAEQHRSQRDDREADREIELHGMDIEVPQQERDRVGADAEEGGMAERQEAGITEQEIEAERGDGCDQAVGQELRLIEIDDLRDQRQREESDGCDRSEG